MKILADWLAISGFVQRQNFPSAIQIFLQILLINISGPGLRKPKANQDRPDQGGAIAGWKMQTSTEKPNHNVPLDQRVFLTTSYRIGNRCNLDRAEDPVSQTE